MSDIKLNRTLPKASAPLRSKAKISSSPRPTETPKTSELKEQFTPSLSSPTPVKSVGKKGAEAPVQGPVDKTRLKKPRGDMAQMVEQLNSGSSNQRAGIGPNGTIVLLSVDSAAQNFQATESGADPSKVEPKIEKKSGRANQMKAGTATHSGPLEAVEVAGVKAYKAAKAAKEVLTEKASAAADVGPDLITDGAQAVQSTKVIGDATKAVGKLSSGLETALKVAGAASAVLSPLMLAIGVKEFSEGRKQGDTDKMLEGAAATTVGARSGVAAAVMGKMAGVVELGATATGVAKAALPVLGVAHGALDVVIGARQIAKGKTTKGLLTMGFGTAVTATAALGLGLPGVAVASGFMVAKITHGVVTGKKAGPKNAPKSS